ncbi:MAG: hypothetical protein ACSHW1_14335 [Yoonia sp.]|uniref:hypothetical protein n=1 Tax=Yoonia sp. TaxID=2212373 RepID=UPI003EF3A3B5
MPLSRLLIILAIVISAAAATVALVLGLASASTGPSVAVLAGISVVTLLASILLRRFLRADDRS